MKRLAQRLLILLFLLSGLVSAGRAADIISQAEVEYVPGGAGPLPPVRLLSNPVRAVIEPLVPPGESLTLTDNRTVALSAAAMASFPHRLLYSGAASTTATLSLLNAGGDDYDLINLRLYRDLNTNGVVDPGEPLVASGSSVPVTPGIPLDFVVVGELPSSPLPPGQFALVELVAVLPSGGLSSMNVDRVTVLAQSGALFTQIVASHHEVEIGDIVLFTVRVRNASGIDLNDVTVTSDLSAGLSYRKGSTELEGVASPNPAGGSGPRLVFNVGPMANDSVATITYRVRAGPSAPKGNGVNTAISKSTLPEEFVSNLASVKLDVKQQGVFSDEGIILGKVFIDENQNRIQDPRELGIPGVRIYMEDGTYVITDGEGKYSLYAISPKTHVLKLDETTLPDGGELLAPSTRHAGSGGTRFADVNRGELHKANFTVGYVTPEFVEAVNQRRLQAERGASEIETTVQGRLTPDGSVLAIGDPRALPASGIIGVAPSGGPSLTGGLVAGSKPPQDPSSGPALPGTASVAQAAPSSESVRTVTNTFGFVNLKDGDTLPMAQATIRVQGVAGAELLLVVNGQGVPVSRLGRRALVAEQSRELFEYIGVPLSPGPNQLELIQKDGFGNVRGQVTIVVIAPDKPAVVRIVTPTEDPIADGVTPVSIAVVVTDATGVPVTARLPFTLETSLGQWQVEDLDRNEPGTQVFVEGGRAEFMLLPPLEPGKSIVRASFGVLEAESTLSFLPDLRPMLAVGVIEGTLNLSDVDARGLFPPRSQDGFAEELQAFALNSDTGSTRYSSRAAFFLKGKVLGKYLLTAGYDSDKDTRERLFRDIQPDEFYPVYGDSSVKGFDAQSTGRLYVRVDRNRCYVLYGDLTTGSTSELRNLGNYSRSLTGARVHLENKRVTANIWASEDSTRQVIEEIRGNGTSGPYLFSQRDGILNSEKVEIITRDRHQRSLVLESETLVRFTDYEFEPFTGRILFRRPVPSLDSNLNPIFIRVTYELDQGGDKFWVYGADAQVKVTERLEVGGAAIRDENPLGSYGLYSANAALKVGPNTFLLGEVARSETELTEGDAGRVELRHQDSKLDGRLYYGQASTTFSNSAALIGAGRIEAGAQFGYRLTPSTRLVGQAIQSESLVDHGRRQGATLSIEQDLGNNVRLEVGGRHSTETSTAASSSTSSPPGITPNEVNSVRAKLTLPVPFVKGASLYGEVENDLFESGKRVVATGGDYQIDSKTRVYARHEFINAIGGPFELNNFQEQNTTVFGLDTSYMKDGSVFSEYRGRDAFAGREAEAAIGLRNGWSLADGLRLNTTFERVNPIEGGNQNEATAGAAAIEYTRNPDWKGTARLELRTSTASDSLLNTLGYARKISSDWTFLGKSIVYSVRNNGPSGGERTQGRFQAGMAYRQTRTDRWNSLLKYEFKYEDDTTQPDLEVERRVHILSLHANYHPTRDWILSGHYATKIAFEDSGGESGVYSAHLGALRLTYDLTKRLDVGLNSSILFDGGFRSIQFGFGPELGWTFINNMRVAAGFNIFGVEDADLSGQNYTNPGFFVSLRWKFDETLLGMGNNSKERSEP